MVDLMETSAGLVTMEVIIATRGVCEGDDAVASRVESGEARAENQQLTSQHTDRFFVGWIWISYL